MASTFSNHHHHHHHHHTTNNNNNSNQQQSNLYNSAEHFSGAKERRNRTDSNSLASMERGFGGGGGNSSSSSSSSPLTNGHLSSSLETSSSSSHELLLNESSTSILLQVLGPLLVAGLGMVVAGLLLDHCSQETPVFRQVGEIFILVPALLGLKGNLEMTMASRLSSIANMGLLKSRLQRVAVFKANIALTQVQSVVVGFCAALFAALINWLNTGAVNVANTAMLAATSILTASLASLILGTIMMLIIVWSLDHNVNPDNIATPIAAALGDLITLYILYTISDVLYRSQDSFSLLSPVLIVGALLLAPLGWRIAAANHHTKVALVEGWTPVILAMTISSLGGCILNQAVARFKSIALYQPLVNGVGGNLAAIQASRMSTFLHLAKGKDSLNHLKSSASSSSSASFSSLSPQLNQSPISFLFRFDIHSRTARILLCLVVPCHLVFLLALSLLHQNTSADSPSSPIPGDHLTHFLLAYLSCCLLQVLLLLYLAELLISWMWSRGIDPDNSAIPYLTALGDLFGTFFLFIAFTSLPR